ncbi:hypothetical protein FA13DRAFT_1787252 [Coprinellus micaceus]|uniref:Uncharacterized protein n=1 Tax=Coprinellus micaceus TaxID=71717 RepID=A0A4Y7TSQ8_COPMI|nr:hypothetical protein FA13DRAFT_1787252 [Coprinellus micaceus]
MQFKSTVLAATALVASTMPLVLGADVVTEGDVFTATRVVHTVIRESPFMVDRTTTVVWTTRHHRHRNAVPRFRRPSRNLPMPGALPIN